MSDAKKAKLRKDALAYHKDPKPGKVALEITKKLDLNLAYSPGVAEPVRAIHKDKQAAYDYTSKSNLVGVVSNGTAVLGLGDVGAMASKPVMEGKAVLLKHFGGVDSFDVEVDETDPEEFIKTVARIAGTFGGINLEDIKAPECFEIEERLKDMCDIPIFHDDQHGTAVVLTAALLNALELQGKALDAVRIVTAGAGASGIACMDMLLTLGAKRENILLCDSKGVIYKGRGHTNKYKDAYAAPEDCKPRSLQDAMEGADVFIGLSGPDTVSVDMVKSMADKPVVFALSNPDPEITPEEAQEARSDLIMATGRSDYPNQVNNVLCFPYMFRGALDVRASAITKEMKAAASKALSKLAHEDVPEGICKHYGLKGDDAKFGKTYLLPKPLDERLRSFVAAAVAKAAVDSGAARLPYPEDYPEPPALD